MRRILDYRFDPLINSHPVSLLPEIKQINRGRLSLWKLCSHGQNPQICSPEACWEITGVHRQFKQTDGALSGERSHVGNKTVF